MEPESSARHSVLIMINTVCSHQDVLFLMGAKDARKW